MRSVARQVAALAIAGCALMGQGCVSLYTHEQSQREIEALKKAYQGADHLVGRYRTEIEARDTRIRDLLKQNADLKGQLRNASTAIEQEKSALEGEYRRMLDDLRAAGGGDFVINESTGGVVLESDIFFASGKKDLKPEATQALDALIAKLNEPRFASARIEVAGHTDQDPISHSRWDDNYQLSAERARAVLLHFVSRGVSEDRIYLSGYGFTRPRSAQKNENRRVEIVLHEK